VRARVESRTHVERLATSAVDGLLVLVEDTGAANDVVDAGSDHKLPTLIEIDQALAPHLIGVNASAIIVRGDDPERVAQTILDLRSRLPSTPLGARILAPAVDPQLSIARAWGILASLSLAVIGVAGPSSLEALPALADLSRAPRASIPG
jgi:hypothetical protein